jgi:hypothetical protein
MEAVREITDWGYNHTYLLDGGRAVAYIAAGRTRPEYFKQPLRFDRRGRRFERVSVSLFPKQDRGQALIEVTGSSGTTYWVNAVLKTCTCPGFTFRGQCRHLAGA